MPNLRTIFASMICLVFIAQTARALNCSFDQNQYFVLRNNDIQLFVNTDYSTALTGKASCDNGQGSFDLKVPVPGDAAPYQLSFNCSYAASGDHHPNVDLTSGPGTCENFTTVTVSDLLVGSFDYSAVVEKGTQAAINVSYTNAGTRTRFATANLSAAPFTNTSQQTAQSLIGFYNFDIAAHQTLTLGYLWDTTQFVPGDYYLISTINSSQHRNSNYTVVSILPKLEILAFYNTTTNSSAVLNVNTSAPSNATVSARSADGSSIVSNDTNLLANRTIGIGPLNSNTTYFGILTVCSQIKCIVREFSFTTLANSASATPSITVTPTPTPSVSTAPSPTATPAPTATPKNTQTPTPTLGQGNGGDTGTQTTTPSTSAKWTDVGKSGEEKKQDLDLTNLEGLLNNETVAKIKNASNFEIFNNITITRMQFDPEIIGAYSKIRMFATTDSEYAIEKVDCHVPSGTVATGKAQCSCELNYMGNFSKFKCDIVPRPPINSLGDSYVIELRNAHGESGFFVAYLPIGKKASLERLTVKAKRNEFYFYVGIFIAMMLVAYGLFHVFSKFEREQKLGETLGQQKKKIIEDMDTLKFHYMKRDIDYDTYNKAMTLKQKQLTEVNTRLAEFESKKTAEKKKESITEAMARAGQVPQKNIENSKQAGGQQPPMQQNP